MNLYNPYNFFLSTSFALCATDVHRSCAPTNLASISSEESTGGSGGLGGGTGVGVGVGVGVEDVEFLFGVADALVVVEVELVVVVVVVEVVEAVEFFLLSSFILVFFVYCKYM
jgi:hypothetical protein